MDDGRLCREMVEADHRAGRGEVADSDVSPTGSLFWLVSRQVVYYVVFLSAVLIILPYLFDRWVGEALAPRAQHAWLQPGTGQQVVGLFAWAAGFLGYTLCSIWLVAVGRGPFVEFDPPKHFVATGPYRLSRNPIVICLITAVAGEAIFFGSPGILLFVFLGLAFAWYQVTRIEEPRLRARFGASYADYCRRVPRWIPGLGRGEGAGAEDAATSATRSGET